MGKRTSLALAATAAFAMSTLFMSHPALAAGPGNIDDSQLPGTLTLHKHVGDSQNANNAVTGDAQPGTPNGTAPNPLDKPVEGVQFTVYKLTSIDLNTSEGWDTISGLADTFPAGSSTCDVPNGSDGNLAKEAQGDPQSTNATGDATFEDLPLGAYLVCETDISQAKVDGKATTITSKSLPFIVTMPFPNGNDWLYSVHAYPKNGQSTVTKQVNMPETLSLGSKITFDVTASIPSGKITYFQFEDPFNPSLTPDDTATVQLLNADNSVAGTVPEGNYEVTKNGQTVDVTFTNDGLTYLQQNAGKQIKVTFTATVTSLSTETSGDITNQAKVRINQSGEPGTPPDDNDVPPAPSNKTHSKYGDLRIEKRDSANNQDLSGATFEIYDAKTPYPTNGQCTATDIATDATAISIGGTTQFVSDDTGLVAGITGLFVSNQNEGGANPAEQGNGSDFRCYVIKEVKAPAGYTLPEQPLTGVKVSARGADVATSTTWDAQIPNTKSKVPTLPLTGGTGQVVMGGAALGLAALGFFLTGARSRRRHATK